MFAHHGLRHVLICEKHTSLPRLSLTKVLPMVSTTRLSYTVLLLPVSWILLTRMPKHQFKCISMASAEPSCSPVHVRQSCSLSHAHHMPWKGCMPLHVAYSGGRDRADQDGRARVREPRHQALLGDACRMCCLFRRASSGSPRRSRASLPAAASPATRSRRALLPAT